MSPLMSPPINALSPCTCPPIWGRQISPCVNGLGKTLYPMGPNSSSRCFQTTNVMLFLTEENLCILYYKNKTKFCILRNKRATKCYILRNKTNPVFCAILHVVSFFLHIIQASVALLLRTLHDSAALLMHKIQDSVALLLCKIYRILLPKYSILFHFCCAQYRILLRLLHYVMQSTTSQKIFELKFSSMD